MYKIFNDFEGIMKTLGYDTYISDTSAFESRDDMISILPVIVELNKIGFKLSGVCDNLSILYTICSLCYYDTSFIEKCKNIDNIKNFVNNTINGIDDDFCTKDIIFKAVKQFERYINAFSYDDVSDVNSLAKCIAYQLTGKEFNFNSLDNTNTIKMFKSDCYIRRVLDCKNKSISYIVDISSNAVIGYRVKFDGKVRDIDLSQLFRLKVQLIGVQKSIKCTLDNDVYISEMERLRGIKIRRISSIELESFINT